VEAHLTVSRGRLRREAAANSDVEDEEAHREDAEEGEAEEAEEDDDADADGEAEEAEEEELLGVVTVGKMWPSMWPTTEST
jgi:hypothetical protein